MPACHDPTRVDVSDVGAAVDHPDVQSALAQPTPQIYGERLVADGPGFAFTLSSGRGFSVGFECATASSTCTPTPPGVQALVQLLRTLLTQQLADPSCAGVAGPP